MNETTTQWRHLSVEVRSVKSMLEEVISNWDRYNSTVASLQAWLEDAEKMLNQPEHARKVSQLEVVWRESSLNNPVAVCYCWSTKVLVHTAACTTPVDTQGTNCIYKFEKLGGFYTRSTQHLYLFCTNTNELQQLCLKFKEILTTWRNQCMHIDDGAWQVYAQHFQQCYLLPSQDFFRHLPQWIQQHTAMNDAGNFLIETCDETISRDLKQQLLLLNGRWRELFMQVKQVCPQCFVPTRIYIRTTISTGLVSVICCLNIVNKNPETWVSKV